MKEIKKKVGRPRKTGVIREPNGRISRAKKSQIIVALSARAKHMDISLVEALEPCAGSFLGKLYLLGEKKGLSHVQYEAALKFLSLLNDYKKTLLSRDAYYEIYQGQLKSIDQIEREKNYAQWCQTIQTRFDQLIDLIKMEQKKSKQCNFLAVLNYVIIEDQWMPHLLEDTRALCNLLIKYFAN